MNYGAGIGSILDLFGSIAKHPSEATLPNRAKAQDIIMADSDLHPVPYIYLAAVAVLLIVSVIILVK